MISKQSDIITNLNREIRTLRSRNEVPTQQQCNQCNQHRAVIADLQKKRKSSWISYDEDIKRLVTASNALTEAAKLLNTTHGNNQPSSLIAAQPQPQQAA